MLQAVRLAFALPSLEWFILEQVPALEYMWEDIAAELYSAGWEFVDVGMLGAIGLRCPVTAAPRLPDRPQDQAGPHPAAGTRHRPYQRRSGSWLGSGGAGQDPGQPQARRRQPVQHREPRLVPHGEGQDLDARVRRRPADQLPGRVLNGFPAGFPWSGSRSRQFLQAANVVAPQVAAALLAEVAA